MKNYCKLLVIILGLQLQSGCGIDRGGIVEPTMFAGAAYIGDIQSVDVSSGMISIGGNDLEITGRPIFINGEPTDVSSLVPGMFGIATLLDEGGVASLSSLKIDYNVAGADIQNGVLPNTVTVLGQIVRTENLSSTFPFSDLIVPNVSTLAFSGFETSTGEILATAVVDYPVGSPVLVTGVARAVDSVNFVFTIGQQLIDYSQVLTLSTSSGSVVDNMRLRIQVEPGLSNAPLMAISITEVPLIDAALPPGAAIEITGFASAPSSGSISFANQDILVDDNTEFQNIELANFGSESLVTVSAVLQADGTVLAVSVAPLN